MGWRCDACPGDVRVEDLPEPTIQAPTDAIIRLAAARVCGSDLWPHSSSDEVLEPKPTGHEYVGVVEQVEWRSRSCSNPDTGTLL